MSNVVIIVGAPRSGTNMLRDVLTALPGVATWNCDEINLMWKHGNRAVPHDELTAAHARPDVARYLRRAFGRLGARHKAHTVVEKTCATSLRVAFAATVFPDAKFIFIRRDGIDAAASAMMRWNAPLDIGYTLKKARYVPIRDLPAHLTAFAAKRARQRAAEVEASSSSLQVRTWWGPRPSDFRQLQQCHSLEEVSLIQWKRCVDLARRDLAMLPSSRTIEVSYEEFVRYPEDGLRRIVEFLGISTGVTCVATSRVNAESIGRGRERLEADVVTRLESLGHDTLFELGYV